jgi:hypothetical protein
VANVIVMANRNQPKGAVMQQTATRPESDSAPEQMIVQDSGPGLVSQIVMEHRVITPEEAQRMLTRNKHNRTLYAQRVETYAGAMTRGEWRDNAATIRFAPDGVLLDGQHRLAAIVEANIPVPMWVALNVPYEAQETMDTGAKRTVGDMLRQRGKPYTLRLPAVARRIMNYYEVNSFVQGGYVRFTEQQSLAFIDEHENDLVEHIRQGARTASGIGTGLTTTLASLSYLFAEVNENLTQDFMLSLQYGTELQRNDPIYVLREQIVNDMRRSTRSADAVTYAAWLIKAFNAVQARQDRADAVLAARRYGARGLPQDQRPPGQQDP